MAIATQLTGTTTQFASVHELSDQNSQGTVLGDTASDLISFYGGPTIAQQNVGPANILAGSVYDTSLLTKYQLTNATVAVAATTTAEVTTTVCTGLLTTDVVAVNKPTTTSGIGVASYRVTGANKIGLGYINVSSGQITTSAETYDVIGISSNLTVTTALSPIACAATTTNEQFFSVAGATIGSLPIVNKPTLQAGLAIGNVRVASEGVVAVTFGNVSSGAITPTAAETYSFAFVPTLAPASNALVYNISQASTAVAASSTAEVTTAVTGLLTADVITGVSKPSYQAGLGVAGYRISSAGNAAVTMMNVSSAVTSTNETYAITVERTNAKAPFVVTTATITSTTAVAASSSSEQTFTVNALLSGSTSVLVSKPSHTPGLIIGGARVSAASTVAINFVNISGASITPPSEVYTIGYIPLVGPGAVATTGTSQSIQVGVNALTSSVKDLRNILLQLNLNAAT